MAFFSDAEEFLARLPSISLEGMEPLFPDSDLVEAKAQAAHLTAKVGELHGCWVGRCQFNVRFTIMFTLR
jgi:hypothetical protein